MSLVEVTKHYCLHVYWVSCLRFCLIQSDMIMVFSRNMLLCLRSKKHTRCCYMGRLVHVVCVLSNDRFCGCILCMILIFFRRFGGICCLHLLCVWIRFGWLLKFLGGGSVSIVQGVCGDSTIVAEREEVLYRTRFEVRLPG